MTKLTGMSFTSDILPLIFSLIAVAAVLYLCYWFSKFIAKKANHAADSANIHILEKVALAQDKGLALAEICGRFYLIGFSNNGVEILQELSKEDLKQQRTVMKGNFLDILNATMKNRWDVKTLGRNNGKSDDANSDEAIGGQDGEDQP